VVSPLLNEANGWDVAWSVLFLAADVSRWTTGTVIPVDAGMLVSAPMSVLQ
jgi:enoyl-[acyl-carrier-protein] reductase (NADH)